MNAGINNVIYMELYSGPKMANGRCGKTIDTGTIDRGSTVYVFSSTQDSLFENIVITKYKIQDIHGLKQILVFPFRSKKKLLCSDI